MLPSSHSTSATECYQSGGVPALQVALVLDHRERFGNQVRSTLGNQASDKNAEAVRQLTSLGVKVVVRGRLLLMACTQKRCLPLSWCCYQPFLRSRVFCFQRLCCVQSRKRLTVPATWHSMSRNGHPGCRRTP